MTDRVTGHLTYYFDTDEAYIAAKTAIVSQPLFANYVFNDETRVIQVDIDTAHED